MCRIFCDVSGQGEKVCRNGGQRKATMRFPIDFTVDYLMAGPEERLRMAALLRMFQEAAVRHA